ncbi:ELKS/Rab6-interacting/CAST family member 1-like [Melitaea cinxia]|uniref:ELKS/Rab6-interacting/CAST family member 1-like n=1 Tax=Melitaea cinxia TaxID=113334 RepID=UPI001E271D52|nr:ELKS/Rab6-interacting/CAST family member 1-like [Melitaea cinxia]
MFSKAKRFESTAHIKSHFNTQNKRDTEKQPSKAPVVLKTKLPSTTPSKESSDAKSQCSSTSTKSFKTPRPLKPSTATNKFTAGSLKKTLPLSKNLPKNHETKDQEELIKAYQVEIRNKDTTISEYNKQIDDLKCEIAKLQNLLQETKKNCDDVEKINNKFSQIAMSDEQPSNDKNANETCPVALINQLNYKIFDLRKNCEKLEKEVSDKQVELSSLEEVITIRDTLCTDLQNKLTNVESCLEETRQRLEMVKGHHALALEANESIRREYKAELETLKTKLDEEKQAILAKSKADQENLKLTYNTLIDSIKCQLKKEKDDKVQELQQSMLAKDREMKAKLEQIDEATHEKLKLCEIQFEERSRHLQEHWAQQQKEIQCLEAEIKELKYLLNINEEKNSVLNKEIKNVQNENDILRTGKANLMKELEDLKDESKKKIIDYENEINKLTVEVDRAIKEKNKFEMSLSVTRDIVQVLTMRLRESDNELEHLESQVQTLTNSKDVLESELASFKNTLNNTVLECNEYKEALVNILKSKAALAKEHNRIMEHNVSLIESLQNVEKEAYRELGSIKSELIEDVEMIKKESKSQIQLLKEEVEKKRVLCELAKEHAGQATAAAEQSRTLLSQAAAEISRLESENHCLQQQIQDQQSLVVELSLLRQENEELTMTLAKQSSVIDKLKKEAEQVPMKPKSPSVMRKGHKIGKENIQVISPLRERNHLIS